MNNEKAWETKIKSLLVGHTIKDAFIMAPEDAEELDWNKRPVVIVLDNDLQLIPSSDDEGNDGGSIMTSNDKLPTIPVF